jgi:hypothetical protein
MAIQGITVRERTDEEILAQTTELAIKFASAMGFVFAGPMDPVQTQSRRKQLYWYLACIAQIVLTETDPYDALSAIEGLEEEKPVFAGDGI